MYKQKVLKIFGERNTGTNYLEKLIEINFLVNILRGTAPKYIIRIQRIIPGNEFLIDYYFAYSYKKNLGWKHQLITNKLLTFTNELPYEVNFITITKNPYSWLLSLYENPYHQHYKHKLDFNEFLKTPWIPTKRENSYKSYENPIDLWNKKNKSYLYMLNNFKVINIKYEDLITNPMLIVNEIGKKFNLNYKHSKLKNYLKSTKESNKSFSYYQNYYLNELWKGKLNNDSIKIINSSLDSELMRKYKYNYL